jgi:sortase (surface protein transpeptidase)
VRFRALVSRRLAAGLAVAVAGLAWAGPAAASTSASAVTLYIPRIGLFTEVNTRSLDLGPMAYFADADTLAIAGHRTTHSRPFYNLDRLRKGDLVRALGINYHVTKKIVVRPWETWPLNHDGIVLSACTPRGSAAYRLVVIAQASER